jgi:hypothetical protein
MGGLQLYKPVIWTLSFPLPKIIYIYRQHIRKEGYDCLSEATIASWDNRPVVSLPRQWVKEKLDASSEIASFDRNYYN